MIRVGVIGLGVMGAIHLRNLSRPGSLASVSAVYDPVAEAVAEACERTGATPAGDSHEVIAATSVDAILIAAPAPLHAELMSLSIAAGKPVFCEKPLVTDISDYRRLTALSESGADSLVWAGFMRRFDQAFVALRDTYQRGDVGQAVFLDMAHRNPSVPATFTNDAYMNETFIHEFDVTRWLLGEDIVTVQVDTVGPTRPGTPLNDPLFVTAWTQSGIPIRISGHITNGYGYDIRCEIVGERGAVQLGGGRLGDARSTGPILAENWGDRFADAYTAILDSWLADLDSARHTGVGLSEGLAASAAALAGLRALGSPGVPVDIASALTPV
jgi:myo-inositol 2-dehydrogenase/D-chiro-inositol 1-dehydrogenase